MIFCTKYSVGRRATLSGSASKEDWLALSAAYTSFFNDSDEVYVEIGHVPLPLRTLFLHLKTRKEEKINLFSNGAGKSFAVKLLECLYLPMNIRTSSTQDPRHDWCGINLPFITGVADVVVAHEGMWRLVGEIKGDQSDGYTQGCYAGQDDEILTMLAIW